ncbi:hypothetical protein BN427_1918 [Klebsiella pneumoniae subsp. pneumoniae ST258-K28BO]|nr:hypothetical protein BN427_1918 [Klebsiella pneumoniae subsp. pneumoniae ST258-K28BO]
MKICRPYPLHHAQKKSARQCIRTAGRLYPRTPEPPLVRCPDFYSLNQ